MDAVLPAALGGTAGSIAGITWLVLLWLGLVVVWLASTPEQRVWWRKRLARRPLVSYVLMVLCFGWLTWRGAADFGSNLTFTQSFLLIGAGLAAIGVGLIWGVRWARRYEVWGQGWRGEEVDVRAYRRVSRGVAIRAGVVFFVFAVVLSVIGVIRS